MADTSGTAHLFELAGRTILGLEAQVAELTAQRDRLLEAIRAARGDDGDPPSPADVVVPSTAPQESEPR